MGSKKKADVSLVCSLKSEEEWNEMMTMQVRNYLYRDSSLKNENLRNKKEGIFVSV